MTRFLHLLYYYILALMVAFVAYITLMLAVSPKVDMQKRGFIPCTEQLVSSVSICKKGSVGCPLKYLWQDMKCNTFVILDGFGAWMRGKQPTPWANYLFEAETIYDDDYDGDVVSDMADLEAQSQFIQGKKEELEEAKNRGLNLRDDVLMSAPEDVLPNDVKADIEQEPAEEDVEQGDISEEAFMDKFEEKQKDE